MKPFSDIQERLAARVSALKYVDEDWGQLDAYEGMPPVKFPCCLIDCGEIAVSQAGSGMMLDRMTIVLRIADIRLSNTSNAAPAGQKAASFQLFETLRQIISALHGWSGSPEVYGKLQRTEQRRIRREDGIRLYEMSFECAMKNIGTVKNLVAVQVLPNINVE